MFYSQYKQFFVSSFKEAIDKHFRIQADDSVNVYDERYFVSPNKIGLTLKYACSIFSAIDRSMNHRVQRLQNNHLGWV